jgi:hypothetical protein
MKESIITKILDWINKILPVEDDQEITEEEILFVYGDD